MTDERFDLSPLDPTKDPRSFDMMARALASEAMKSRRRSQADTLADVARWTLPGLAAAALVAACATFALLSLGNPRKAAATPDSLSDLVGIPSQVVEWSYGNHQPSPLELVAALSNTWDSRAGGGQ